MKLRWRGYERKLRRVVIRRLRQSPADFRKYKENRRGFRRGTRIVLPSAVWALIVFGILYANFESLQSHPDRLLALMSLAALGNCMLLACSFWSGLHYSAELAVLAHFPISDRCFLNSERRKFAWACIQTTAAHGVAMLIIVSPLSLRGADLPWGYLFVAALAHGAVMTAGAVIVMRYPRLMSGNAGLGCLVATVLLMLLFNFMSDQAAAPLLTALFALPTGWIPRGVAMAMIDDGSPLVYWLGGVAVCMLALPALRQLGRSYATDGPRHGALLNELCEDGLTDEQIDEVYDLMAPPHSDGEMKIDLDDLPIQPAGLLERAAFRITRPGERALLCFLLGHLPNWTKKLYWATGIVVITTILTIAGIVAYSMALAPLAVAAMLCLPLAGGQWHAYAKLDALGYRSTVASFYPIRWDAALRLMLTVNGLRVVCALPLIVGSVWLILKYAAPDLDGLAWAVFLKVALIILSLIPLLTSGVIMRNWRMTRLRHKFAATVAAVTAALLFVGIWVWMFLPNPTAVWAAPTLLAVVTALTWAMPAAVVRARTDCV